MALQSPEMFCRLASRTAFSRLPRTPTRHLWMLFAQAKRWPKFSKPFLTSFLLLYSLRKSILTSRSINDGRCNDAVPDCAPDPRFSAVTEFDTKAVSNYHGLIVSGQHRLRAWGQGLLQANYTYSHALDEVSNGGTAPFSNWARQPFSIFPLDPNNLRGSYGPADYDVRHSFNASYVWQVPVKAIVGGHGPNVLIKGWQVSGTVFARTGLPYTVLDIFPPPDLVQKNYFGILYGVPVRPLGPSPPCGKGAAAT